MAIERGKGSVAPIISRIFLTDFLVASCRLLGFGEARGPFTLHALGKTKREHSPATGSLQPGMSMNTLRTYRQHYHTKTVESLDEELISTIPRLEVRGSHGICHINGPKRLLT